MRGLYYIRQFNMDVCNDGVNSNGQNKLRIYALFKKDIQTEKYLFHVENRKLRTNIIDLFSSYKNQ